MKTTSVACLVLASSFASVAHATNWSGPEPTAQPMSSGAYTCHWPSRYNGVEKSSAQSNPDTRGTIELLRVLAHHHEASLRDFDGAAALRRTALQMIESALAMQLRPAERMSYLFASALYNRESGDLAKSEASARLLRQTLQENKDNEIAGLVAYLTELSQDIEKIVPGGPLTPK